MVLSFLEVTAFFAWIDYFYSKKNSLVMQRLSRRSINSV